MKRIFLVIAFALTASLTTIAQTPRVDQMMKERVSLPWTGTIYRACVDSLSTYILKKYGGMHTKSYAINEVTAPVKGSDEKLREVTSHIVNRLSSLNTLQTYSERIDDGNELRGRLILKLRPEGEDTTAYIFAKYDRNTIIVKLLTDRAIDISTNPRNTNRSWKEDELSLWKKLRKEFYGLGSNVDRNVQMKWHIVNLNKNDEDHFFITTPEPKQGSEVIWQFLQTNDSSKWEFESTKDLLELAGKEDGSTYGVLTNKALRADSCHYYYASRTKPDGQSEMFGVTHEDGISYFFHATSEEPGLFAIPWGRTFWDKNQESEYDSLMVIAVYVIDEATNKTIKDAKLTFMKPDRKTVIETKDYLVAHLGRDIYRHGCWLQPHDRYILKIEVEGYKTEWAEITPDKEVEKGRFNARIEVGLQPKR